MTDREPKSNNREITNDNLKHALDEALKHSAKIVDPEHAEIQAVEQTRAERAEAAAESEFNRHDKFRSDKKIRRDKQNEARRQGKTDTLKANTENIQSVPEANESIGTREEMLRYINEGTFYNEQEKANYATISNEELEQVYTTKKSLEEMGQNVNQSFTESPQGSPDLVAENTKPEPAQTTPEPVIPDVKPELRLTLDPTIPIVETPQEDLKTPELAKAESLKGFGAKLNIKFDYSSPHDLRERMREMLGKDIEPESWVKVREVEDRLSAAYGMMLVRGRIGERNLTPEEHLEAYEKIERALEALPGANFNKQGFVIGREGDPHDASLIILDPSYSDEGFEIKLTTALHPTSLSNVIPKPEDAQPVQPETVTPEEAPKEAFVAEPVAPLKNKITFKTFVQPGVEARMAADQSGVKINAQSPPEVKSPESLVVPTPEQVVPAVEIEPTTPENPESLNPLSSKDLEDSLNAARRSYVNAKRTHDDFAALRTLRDKVGINLKPEERATAEKTLAEAKSKYEQARAEYMGADIERYLLERTALIQSHLDEYRTLDNGIGTKINQAGIKLYQGWKKLGEWNIYDKAGMSMQNRAGKAIFKSMSARTFISLGLLGSGVYFGPTTLGLASLGVRRGLTAIGSAVGSRDLLESARQGLKNTPFTEQQISELTLIDEVESRMSQIESRAFFDGKSLTDITSSKEYILLQAKQRELLSLGNADSVDDDQKLSNRLGFNDDKLFAEKQKEGSGRKKTIIAGSVVGALVGGGVVGKAINYLNSGVESPVKLDTKFSTSVEADRLEALEEVDPNINNPNGESITEPASIKSPEAEISQAPSAAEISTAAPELNVGDTITIIQAGPRGLEGALLDLKDSDPAKYKGMLQWIKEHSTNKNASDGALIHNIVKSLAEKNGFTVDGAINNISKLDSGSINLKSLPNGEYALELDKAKIDLANVEVGAPKIANTGPTLASDDHVEVTASDVSVDDAPKPIVDQEPQIIKTSEEIKIGPEEIEVQKLDFDQLKPDKINSISSITAETAELALKEARVEQAISSVRNFSKTSDALKELLGKEYKAFEKEVFNFDARQLNKFQGESVDEFIKFYAHPQLSDTNKKAFKILNESIKNLLSRSSEGEQIVITRSSIREMLIRLAVERKSS